MQLPPLKSLHPDSALSAPKLAKTRRMTTQEILDSLRPGLPESLKARPDGTIMNGHHRIKILKERGMNVDSLPRDVVALDPGPPQWS